MLGDNVSVRHRDLPTPVPPTHQFASFSAHPVTVPHPNCGHTFCALCMVKHFFSRFHRTCGGWHEHVECPMCRSILIYTPNQLPRSLLTFPFAKNRMADAAVAAMIDQLTAQIEDVGIPSPCEDVEQTKGGIKTDCESPLAVWRMGGSSRIEWLERREYVFQLSIFSPRFTQHRLHYGVLQKGQTYVYRYRNTFVCADIFSQRKWIISVGTGPRSLLTSSSNKGQVGGLTLRRI
jgi:hypothetical protein